MSAPHVARGDTLETVIGACAPPGATFAAGPLPDRQAPLLGDEEAEIGKAVEARRLGFRAGRSCARDALARLGIAPCAIPAAPDRRPLWPDGIVGSITHSSHMAAAVTGRDTRFAGLGIDLEPADPLAPHLVDAICRPEERALDPPGIDPAKLVFVIKEAFYKAYYPATLQFLDFPDARVSLGPETGTFSASLTDPAHASVDGRRSIPGRWRLTQGHVVAVAALPRR